MSENETVVAQVEDIKPAKHAGGRPLKFRTSAELFRKGMEYIDICNDKKEPITITGLAIHLDTTRDVLCDYENKYGDEFSRTVKKLKHRVENYIETQVHKNKNPAGPIFLLKNFGWTDRMEVEHSGLTPTTINVVVYQPTAALPPAPPDDVIDVEPSP